MPRPPVATRAIVRATSFASVPVQVKTAAESPSASRPVSRSA
jgi:hypothetical protein